MVSTTYTCMYKISMMIHGRRDIVIVFLINFRSSKISFAYLASYLKTILYLV